jgi:glycosyltransferase involved in cell wall biosynthesis
MAVSSEASIPLVTILTPTFNDAGHLPALIESVLGQSYANWQWIIVDDGSTDETPQILARLTDPRIRTMRKENDDQLNALAHALPHVRGEVVTLIHSDDSFVSSRSIAKAVEHLLRNGADGLYADFKKMDAAGNPTGTLKTPDAVTPRLGSLSVLHQGTNFVGDPFFARRAVFDSHIVPNYIRQNTIYYFDYQGTATLRLEKTEPWYCYRVFGENYIHSDIGKFVALSGQFRTVGRLVDGGVRPGASVMAGYAGFRLARRLNVSLSWPRFGSEEYGARFFAFWARDLVRYGYPQLLVRIANAIAHSYGVRGKRGQPRTWTADTQLPAFGPADSRRFFRLYQAGSIPEGCLALLDQGFDHIVVRDEVAAQQAKGWLNFFSLRYPVVEQAA